MDSLDFVPAFADFNVGRAVCMFFCVKLCQWVFALYGRQPELLRFSCCQIVRVTGVSAFHDRKFNLPSAVCLTAPEYSRVFCSEGLQGPCSVRRGSLAVFGTANHAAGHKYAPELAV